MSLAYASCAPFHLFCVDGMVESCQESFSRTNLVKKGIFMNLWFCILFVCSLILS
jgi:hypothetical protein